MRSTTLIIALVGLGATARADPEDARALVPVTLVSPGAGAALFVDGQPCATPCRLTVAAGPAMLNGELRPAASRFTEPVNRMLLLPPRPSLVKVVPSRVGLAVAGSMLLAVGTMLGAAGTYTGAAPPPRASIPDGALGPPHDGWVVGGPMLVAGAVSIVVGAVLLACYRGQKITVE
jgi:hypothetical protein